MNDDPALADGLASLVEGLPAHFNLMCARTASARAGSGGRAFFFFYAASPRPLYRNSPFNPWPGAEYECSDPEAIETFRQALVHRGLFASVRTSRGDDILAACGQLRSAGAEPAV